MNLSSAYRIVRRRLGVSHPVRTVLAAARDMSARVQQSDVTVVMETLAQADELGVSIGQILRILGDQMRQKRFALSSSIPCATWD